MIEREEAKVSQSRGYRLRMQIDRNVKDEDERNVQIQALMGGKGGHNSGSASTHVPARLQPTDVTMQVDPCNTVNCAETGHDRYGANNVWNHEGEALQQTRSLERRR